MNALVTRPVDRVLQAGQIMMLLCRIYQLTVDRSYKDGEIQEGDYTHLMKFLREGNPSKIGFIFFFTTNIQEVVGFREHGWPIIPVVDSHKDMSLWENIPFIKMSRSKGVDYVRYESFSEAITQQMIIEASANT